MTPLIAARSKWVKSFSRRLFTVVDMTSAPPAWEELLRDPAERLESQLAWVTAEREEEGGFVPAAISRVGLPGPPAERGNARVMQDFGSAEMRSVRSVDVPRVDQERAPRVAAGAAVVHEFAEKSVSPLSLLFPSSDRRGGGGIKKEAPFEKAADGLVRNQISPSLSTAPSLPNEPLMRSGSPHLRGGEMTASTTPVTPVAPTPAPTRLVRGAGGLAGLLRANTEKQFNLDTPRQFSGINPIIPTDLTPAPPPPEPTALITGGAHQTPVHSQIPAPLEPPRPAPPGSTTAPTIDDVLAELYERIHLDYLRTYGASGD